LARATLRSPCRSTPLAALRRPHRRRRVVVAFGSRTLTDFGPFYQIPASIISPELDEPTRQGLVAKGEATTTFFLSPIDPRTAFYYGRRPDSTSVERTLGVKARAFSALGTFVDSLASLSPAPTFYTLADFGDADFAHQDSLTRGHSFMKAVAAKHPGVTVKNAHDIVMGVF
jgi:Xaa-Pro aminopeptidase